MVDTVDWKFFDDVARRQDAVQKHAQTLRCPDCGSEQNQIMNQAILYTKFEWRCRTCKKHFISGGPEKMAQPETFDATKFSPPSGMDIGVPISYTKEEGGSWINYARHFDLETEFNGAYAIKFSSGLIFDCMLGIWRK